MRQIGYRCNLPINSKPLSEAHFAELKQRIEFLEQCDAKSLRESFDVSVEVSSGDQKMVLGVFLAKNLVVVVMYDVQGDVPYILSAVDIARLARTTKDRGCVLYRGELKSEVFVYRLSLALWDQTTMVMEWSIRMGNRLVSGDLKAIFLDVSDPAALKAG